MGLVCFGVNTVIPVVLNRDSLGPIHMTHQGILHMIEIHNPSIRLIIPRPILPIIRLERRKLRSRLTRFRAKDVVPWNTAYDLLACLCELRGEGDGFGGGEVVCLVCPLKMLVR
jgi:hypothetical protein